MRSEVAYPRGYDDIPIGRSGEINRKQFPKGSVVYYVKHNGYDREVGYGTVEENYTDEICIRLYEPRECRKVNGIPLDEFTTPTRWQKLPKGWTFSTDLFELTFDNLPEQAKTLSLKKPEDIMTAIEEKILVPVECIDHCHIETEIDNRLGFRIVRKYPYGGHHPWYVSVRFDQVYGAYEEAKAICDEHYAKFQAQANMTEAEWSISLIDDDLQRWAKRYEHSEAEVRRYRDWIPTASPHTQKCV